MNTYTVTLVGVVNYTTETRASSAREAAKEAAEDGPGLCHHCTSPRRGTEVELGDDWAVFAVYDADGSPVEHEGEE